MKSFLVITFLILFSIFPLVYADTIENPVFSFQKDGVFDEESATEWAKLNNEIPEMDKATVCTWFKVYFHRYENTVWTYCIEKDSNLICNGLGNFEDKYFFFQFFSISLFFSFVRIENCTNCIWTGDSTKCIGYIQNTPMEFTMFYSTKIRFVSQKH